jgi:hypothetical protein
VIGEAMIQYLENKLWKEDYLDFMMGLRAMEEDVKLSVRKGRGDSSAKSQKAQVTGYKSLQF